MSADDAQWAGQAVRVADVNPKPRSETWRRAMARETGRKRGEAKQLFQACGNGCVVAERKLLGQGRGRGTKYVVAAWACAEKEEQ